MTDRASSSTLSLPRRPFSSLSIRLSIFLFGAASVFDASCDTRPTLPIVPRAYLAAATLREAEAECISPHYTESNISRRINASPVEIPSLHCSRIPYRGRTGGSCIPRRNIFQANENFQFSQNCSTQDNRREIRNDPRAFRSVANASDYKDIKVAARSLR